MHNVTIFIIRKQSHATKERLDAAPIIPGKIFTLLFANFLVLTLPV